MTTLHPKAPSGTNFCRVFSVNLSGSRPRFTHLQIVQKLDLLGLLRLAVAALYFLEVSRDSRWDHLGLISVDVGLYFLTTQSHGTLRDSYPKGDVLVGFSRS